MKNKLSKLNSTERGFTLIELLIVVTIIAVLSIIGAVVYSGLQKSSRDSRRIADINAIANAMETAYAQSNTGLYPALAGTAFSSGVVPTDPINISTPANTTCSGGVGGNTGGCYYCLRAAVGRCAGTPAEAAVAAGSPAAVASWIICANLEGTSGGNTYYCRKNTQ